MKFETLSTRHLEMLFQFETDNRAWFDSMISARESNFYSYQGVRMHIFDSMLNMKLQKHFSGVLIHNERIVARANLKDISLDNNQCAVGYRVAKDSIGKGYASYCLSELIRIAVDYYGIDSIEAQVLDNNPASKAVLQKFGFMAETHQVNFLDINGVKLGCKTYSLCLDNIQRRQN